MSAAEHASQASSAERCKRTSEWTSEWPCTPICTLSYSGPQCRVDISDFWRENGIKAIKNDCLQLLMVLRGSQGLYRCCCCCLFLVLLMLLLPFLILLCMLLLFLILLLLIVPFFGATDVATAFFGTAVYAAAVFATAVTTVTTKLSLLCCCSDCRYFLLLR